MFVGAVKFQTTNHAELLRYPGQFARYGICMVPCNCSAPFHRFLKAIMLVAGPVQYGTCSDAWDGIKTFTRETLKSVATDLALTL